jgi:hypothetical protein
MRSRSGQLPLAKMSSTGRRAEIGTAAQFRGDEIYGVKLRC